MAATVLSSARQVADRRRLITRSVLAAGAIALLIAMVLGTKLIPLSDPGALGPEKFDAAQYADENFESLIVTTILSDAVPADELVAAISADLDEAGATFGHRDGQSAWAFPVSFEGVAGEVNPVSGQLPVAIDGFPDDIRVIVQMGPAINGSALRDVTGEISFGMFTNQLEFQSVAVELNNKVKELVLVGIDPATLNGQPVRVVGAFSAGNPAAWIVTPVQFEVLG